MLALWTIGIPTALMIGSQAIDWLEHRRLAAVRAKIRNQRTTRERLSHLAQTWREAFDRIVPGFARGHGGFGKVARRVAGIAVLTATAAAGAATAAGLIAMSVGAEANQAVSVISVPRFQERVAGIARLRSLRPPIDPSISPERAGYALQSLGAAGGRTLSALEAPVKYPIERPLVMPDGPDPFPGTFLKGNAIRQARASLTVEQRRFLEAVAAMPGAAEFSILARGSVADWIGTALVSPLPEGTALGEIPIPRFSSVRNAAYANVARAALAVADGRHAAAEAYLRENIGAGFVMIESPVLIENLVGVVVVKAGRDGLVPLYEMTGRAAEARAVSPAVDPVRDEVPELPRATPSPAEREAYRQSVIRDPGMVRGLRWEFSVMGLAYEPCNDLGQILFGPDETHKERLAEARSLLVRTPGEDNLMRVAERALETATDPRNLGIPVSVGSRALEMFARSVDALTGSRRMQACASNRLMY